MPRDPMDIIAIDPAATYFADEVAQLLFGCTLRTFNRHRRQRAREGFPAPVSKWGRKVWSGAALLAWQARQPATAADSKLVDLSSYLAAKAAQAARRGR